jgi:hypothetical protein
MRRPTGSLVVALLTLPIGAGLTEPALAYYLDSERRFDVRLRAYSQLGILTENSETSSGTDVTRVLRFVPANSAQRRAKIAAISPPKYEAFDLAQHRNFY